MANKFTLKEVAKHAAGDSLWIVVDQKIFDVTAYLKDHPGGPAILKGVAGKDCTKEFYEAHEPSRPNVKKVLKKLKVGDVQKAAAKAAVKKKEKEKEAPSKPEDDVSKHKEASDPNAEDDTKQKASEDLEPNVGKHIEQISIEKHTPEIAGEEAAVKNKENEEEQLRKKAEDEQEDRMREKAEEDKCKAQSLEQEASTNFAGQGAPEQEIQTDLGKESIQQGLEPSRSAFFACCQGGNSDQDASGMPMVTQQYD